MRRKLDIENKTRWSTYDLRGFFLAAMKERGIDTLTVEVVYGRGDHVGGRGSYHLPWIKLMIPSGPEINMRQLAQVTLHEIDHTLGLDHKDMVDWWEIEPTFHEGLSIRWKETPKKTAEQRVAARTAAVEQRAAHARGMLKKARTRLKRAKTIEAKWAKKVRYYERQGK
jgi:hypothetical protein